MTVSKNLPPTLQEKGLFCCWKMELRDDKPTKVPYNPRTGGKAQSTNPDTFAPLQVAERANSGYNGLGVGIFGSLGAIDIDHCIDDNGNLSDIARDIMQTMNAYTELSPSGSGLRILFRAENFQFDKQRYFIHNRNIGVEVYIAGCTNKYVTVTGDALTPGVDLQERSAEVSAILERYMQRSPDSTTHDAGSTLDDMELIQQIRRSKTGADFERLWSKNHTYKSDSEADLALCNMLAWWTSCDAQRMDRLFRQSGLFRPKWDRRQSGTTYGAITIQKAIENCDGGYNPEEYRKPAAPEQKRTLEIVSASDVPYEPPRWLIAPFFQKGKGTLIQGDPGSGKTAFMCAVAAHVSTGKPLLGMAITDPGNVLILSVEDDLPVLRGRIEANGGDLSKCHFVKNAAGLTITSPEIEGAISEYNAKMVIFDPFQAFLGSSVDMFRANETRPALATLFEMCERNDCACAIIAHMGKSGGDKSAVNRSLGSVDIPAAMRSVLHLVKNPDNEDERIMVHVKCSNAPKGRSIAYTIGERGGVSWTGFSDYTTEDLQYMQKRKDKAIPYDNEPLVQVFNQLITDNPSGGFWKYPDFEKKCIDILGYSPYINIHELKHRINDIKLELQRKDGLIINAGAVGSHNIRGVQITSFKLPQGYQVTMHTES